MTVRIHYNELVKEKARRVLAEAEEAFPVVKTSTRKDANVEVRDNFIREKTALSIGYIAGIVSGVFAEPSGRVLKNLGIEVWLKDIETGEMMEAEYRGRCDIEHSQPTNLSSFNG